MKMILYLMLMSILAVNARIIKRSCDGVEINGVLHESEVLHEDLDRPYLLAVDYSTNILYFSYSVKEEEDSSKSARVNLNTKEFADIAGVTNGFAQTVDQKHHEIYIGGSNGISKYDYGKNKVDVLVKDLNIWNMYFKDVLYFSVYPTQFLYTYSEGQTVRFKDLEDTKVDNFIIDNDNIIYFTNATGFYSQKKGTKDAVLYNNSTLVFRGLTTDMNGKVYVCLQDGIYIVNNSTTTIDKVVDIEDAFGIAFDIDNNIVYADGTSLVRLKPNKDKSC